MKSGIQRGKKRRKSRVKNKEQKINKGKLPMEFKKLPNKNQKLQQKQGNSQGYQKLLKFPLEKSSENEESGPAMVNAEGLLDRQQVTKERKWICANWETPIKAAGLILGKLKHYEFLWNVEYYKFFII